MTRDLPLLPESFTSRMRFAAEVELEGKDGVPVATVLIARIGLMMTLFPDWLRIHVNRHRAIDLRRWRAVDATHRGGLIEVRVDGAVVASNLVYRETLWERPPGKASLRGYRLRVEDVANV